MQRATVETPSYVRHKDHSGDIDFDEFMALMNSEEVTRRRSKEGAAMSKVQSALSMEFFTRVGRGFENGEFLAVWPRAPFGPGAGFSLLVPRLGVVYGWRTSSDGG